MFYAFNQYNNVSREDDILTQSDTIFTGIYNELAPLCIAQSCRSIAARKPWMVLPEHTHDVYHVYIRTLSTSAPSNVYDMTSEQLPPTVTYSCRHSKGNE